MTRAILGIALIWAILMPPFFTNGACTAEFDQVARQIQDNKPALSSPASALSYWNSLHMPIQVISAERCRISKPRFVEDCGRGDLLYVTVPIKNKVCHFYRDSAVRIQLHYDDRGRLRQLQADMKPFKYFSFPWLRHDLNWGR